MFYRHGDVGLLKIDAEVPPASKEINRDKGRIVLAYGEVTGHAHAIKARDVTMFEDAQGQRFLCVEDPKGVELTHEEHHTILLPKGVYKIIHQVEYDEIAGVRRVID